MDKIYELAYELKNALANDERVIKLNELEKAMMNDELAMAMSYRKDLAVDEYNFALNHFAQDSEEVKNAQKKLHDAKLDLDLVDSVRSYLDAYNKVRDLYMEINEKLFSILNINLCEVKR